MSEDILERAKKAIIDDDMTYEDYDECISLLIAEVERLRSLENCVSLVIDRQGKTNAAQLGQLDVISAYLDAELVEWKNGDQIAEIAIKFMDLQKQKLNDANSQIAAKDARIKELEEMIRQLGSLAFMGDMPLDQIVAHFIAWGQSNYDYTSRLEAAFLEAEEQRLAFCKNFNHDPKDRWVVVDMDGERMEAEAREALERIKEGGKDE